MDDTGTVTLEVGEGCKYKTVTQALEFANTIPETPVEIHLRPGVYHERPEIRRGGVTLRGDGAATTKITFDASANDRLPDGERRGTFRSYTLLITAPNVRLQDLTVENSAGPREGSGQCVALYAEGEGIVVERCRIVSAQDTLFTGPLPPKELEKNGFRGPTEHFERVNGRQYYFDCYICGTVDFIFGSATAYFRNCTIESILRPGYVTAASTPQGQRYGYVFDTCRFISGLGEGTVYLGRPWRDFAKTVVLRSYLGAHIRPEKWHDWGKEAARTSSYYAEFENYGPGARGEHVPWAHTLTPEEASEYTLDKIGLPPASDRAGIL